MIKDKKRKEAQVEGGGSFFLPRLSFKIVLGFRASGGGGASGSGLRPADGAESGRGLRGLTTMPPGGAAGAGAGVAQIVEADGLGAVIDGDGEGLGAGELRVEADDFRDGVAGCGGDRRIACTVGIFWPGMVSLMTLDFF